ncbi:hypothetical protein HBB16_14885 [Pseudonocardia sp. MCCB 268]|nr:hypothetical protein [Pseudonocardia cytotoxica]
MLDAVAVMDQLRSPGGCPWDAEADPHLAAALPRRGCYELYQSIEDGDRAELRQAR